MLDQDLAAQSLDRFFGFHWGKLSLNAYAVEFDSAGLQLNEVGKFWLFFRNSGLAAKTIDDIKLQVGGNFTRFSDARTLALRMSPNRTSDEADIFHAETPHENYYQSYDDEYYYDDGWSSWSSWYGFENEYDEGDWFWDDGEDWYQDGWYYAGEDEWWYDESQEEPDPAAQVPPDAAAEQQQEDEQTTENFYGGKGDGCYTCGSKWHHAHECPMKVVSGKGKQKGKGKGKFRKGFPRYGKGYGWSYPKGKSMGTGKSKGKKEVWFNKRGKAINIDLEEGIPDESSTARNRDVFPSSQVSSSSTARTRTTYTTSITHTRPRSLSCTPLRKKNFSILPRRAPLPPILEKVKLKV